MNQSTNITKSKFMEYIRCRRYPALNHIHKRMDVDDVLKDRFYDVLNELEYEDDLKDDFLEMDTTHLDVMMPYYNLVEVMVARKVMALFGGETTYSTEFGKQKLFLRDYKGFNLQCYVDIYNKQQSQINIIEAKATTTNKFMSMKYKENKVDQFLFYRDENNILHLSEERFPELLSNPKYMKQREKLFDRMHGAGVYVYDLAFQRYVIEEDIDGAKFYLGVLNHEYYFDGTYVDGEPLYTEEVACLVDLTQITKEMMPLIEKDIQTVVDRILDDDESRVHLGKHCQLKKMRQCIYKDICYDRFPKKNSILMFLDKHHGFKEVDTGIKHDLFDLIEEGYYSMTDLPHEYLNRKNNQIQRDVALTKKRYMNERKMAAAINELKYPLYHLDFESFPCPFPRFKGEKPYDQSLFQFSLHIEREPGVCDKEEDHYEYLSKNHNDNRLEMVERMIEYIKPDGGSVVVFNETFEKTRIKELAQLFPQYSEQLMDISSRLFDLFYVVKTNSKLFVSLGFSEEEAKTINFYDEELYGSFSIKKVLPIFSELTYKGMVVGNGMEAVYAYAGYKDMTDEERTHKQQALVEYCKQDTWAMVEILDELRKIV